MNMKQPMGIGITSAEILAEMGRLHMVVEKQGAIIAEKDRIIADLNSRLESIRFDIGKESSVTK